MNDLITVGNYIERLKQFPADWRVVVSTRAGGRISVEHREINGKPIIAVFGSNGGSFGENPLTEEEYQRVSQDFLKKFNNPNYAYTTIHGDHRIYSPSSGSLASSYGSHYDRRIIERMVAEGKIQIPNNEIERVRYLHG